MANYIARVELHKLTAMTMNSSIPAWRTRDIPERSKATMEKPINYRLEHR
jgi:hypothetical protein